MTGTSRRTCLGERPWAFDVLDLMRELDRSHPDKPRIGTAPRAGQDIVDIRQDPFLAFPACNVVRAELPGTPGDPTALYVQFMGMFGPQGPLPLTMTLEAHHWIHQRNDPSFARFADIFSTRFVQMFYRAWADARAVVHLDRPADDRFRAWTGSLIGYGTPALRDRDALDDDTRRHLLGLWGGRVRSGTRLLQLLRQIMDMAVDLDERVGSWLDFHPDDLTHLGAESAVLGRNCCLGARAYSVTHKIRVTLHCRDLAEYEACLPGRADCTRLVDFLYSYLGATTEVDIALTLPEPTLPATRLGQAGQLGWTSFMPAPANTDTDPAAPDAPVVCAVFSGTHQGRATPVTPGMPGPAPADPDPPDRKLHP